MNQTEELAAQCFQQISISFGVIFFRDSTLTDPSFTLKTCLRSANPPSMIFSCVSRCSTFSAASFVSRSEFTIFVNSATVIFFPVKPWNRRSDRRPW